MILMVFSNLPKPSKAKYSHCTGMMTESAAVKELMVIRPRALPVQSLKRVFASVLYLLAAYMLYKGLST